MKRIWQDNKIMLTFFGFVACVVACFVLTNAMVPTVSANDTRGNVDYSLAKVSQSAALYVNTMAGPGWEGCNEIPADLNVGNAGGLVGVFDTDAQDKSYWLASRETGNILVWAYNSLGNIKIGESTPAWSMSRGDYIVTPTTPSPQGYAAYGYALNEMGLDEVNIGNNASGLRMVIGISFICLYVLAIGMSSFFNLCISILEIANPFKMFSKAGAAATAAARGSGGGWIPDFSANGYGWGGSIVQALSEFQTQVGKLYDILFDMSLMLLIPLAIAIAFFLWLVVNKGQNFKGIFKNLFIRIIFICIGVPALFAVYGVVLDSIKGSVTASGSPATTVVGSMFCDFQNWALSETNIALPDGSVTIDLATKSLDADSVSNVRSMCYKINQTYHEGVFTSNDIPGSNGGNSLQQYAQYDDALMKNQYRPKYTVGRIGDTNMVEEADNIAVILGMLTRYATGEVVSAADFESNVAKGLLNTNERQAVILFGTSSTWTNFDEKQAAPFEYNGNDGGTAGQSSKNTKLDIRLSDKMVSDIAMARWSGASEFSDVDIFTNGKLDGHPSGDKWTFDACNDRALSTLAMYNYLNTQFTASGARVSSPNATSNDQVKYEHYAVTSVGTGVMKVVYLLDALCLLGCASIIGYGYGLAMMLGNFKALFKMIPPVLTGMLGSLRGIASAIVLTFAMICEVVFTVVMFDVAMTIIFSIYKLVELPLATLLSDLSGFNMDTGGVIITALLGVVSVAAILTISKKLLQWRSAVVSATTQACTDFVNKMLGVQVSRPDLDTDGNKLLAAGATVASLGVAAARGGLINGDSMASIQDKTKQSLTSAFGDEAKTKAAVEGALGVEHGSLGEEVDASVSGASGETLSDSNMLDNVSESDRSVIDSRNNYAAERGVNDDYAAEVIADSNSAEFENEIGYGEAAEDEGNPLVGDDTTAKTAASYTTTKTGTRDVTVNEDGTVTETTTYGDVTESVTRDSNGKIVGQSKLTANSDGSSDSMEVTGSDLSVDEHGNYVDMNSRKTVHTDANGTQTIHEEVKVEGGRTVVDQTISRDDAGNVTTVSQSSGPGGLHTSETMVSNAETGDAHIDRQISTPAGTTYVHEDHRIDGEGRVVVDSNVVNNDGSRVNTSSLNTKGGDLISSTERVYNVSGQEVSNTITEVTRQNSTTTVNRTTNSGGQTIHVVDNYDMNKGVGSSITTTTQGNVRNVTRQQYKYNESNERVILNEVNRNNVYTTKGNQTDYSAWSGVGAGSKGSSSPKYNQGVSGGTPYGGTGRNASTGDYRGSRPGSMEVRR